MKASVSSVALVAMVGLPGCILVTPDEWDRAIDRDRDGHVAVELGGDDCNDADATIHPDLPEVCGDNVDNDCDGATDDDGQGASDWYPDADGDGFGVDVPVRACAAPEHTVADLDRGLDCDDTRSDVHPGAAEVWYDGVDQDCDEGDDYDRDGDGFPIDIHPGGTDCDDDAGDVHPGVTEICGNHVDEDCDEAAPTCVLAGELTLSAVRHASLVWTANASAVLVPGVADLDGDGSDDVALVGLLEPNLFAFHGPFAGALTTEDDADVSLDMFGVTPFPGQSWGFDLGNINGDASADLLLFTMPFGTTQSTYLPEIELFLGPLRANLTLMDKTKYYRGPETTYDEEFGSPARYLEDVDGDGVSSWVAVYASSGSCLVVDGPPAGVTLALGAQLNVSDCDGVAVVPDQDADGTPDLLVASGATVRTLSGTRSGTIAADTLPARTPWSTAPEAFDLLGRADLDGNGVGDVLVAVEEGGAPVRAEVWLAPLSSLDAAAPRIVVEEPGHDVRIATTDLDDDGRADLIAAFAPTSGPVEVAVYYGPLTAGILDLDAADVRIDLGAPGEARVESGDCDGDGYGDIVVGGTGTAWVLYGKGG